jgi:predicted transcriptional regulator
MNADLSPKKLVDSFPVSLYTPKNLGDSMARPKTENLTPLELEIMHVLWETGPANVQTVQQKLKRELAYTTVQTMLNILERKGKAKRTLKNRAYFYKPAVSRKHVVGKHVKDVVDRLFGGSAESLVMSLLETKHLTPEKLARLQELVKNAREENEDEDK